MKHYQPFIVFWALIITALCSSIGSYKAAEHDISLDIQQALALTLEEQPRQVITPDTIQTFNQHLQTAALRGQAVLTVDTHQPEFTLQAYCPTSTILAMSDQRPAAAWASLALAWALGCGFRLRRQTLPREGITFGGLTLSSNRFFSNADMEVKFTPMQHQLMTLFFLAPDHRLTKEQICDALWPKKDDASETLYTLIRRLKTVLEAQSHLHILSDRSKAYQLTDSELS